MDVALEMEKQAERAALVNAACSAHCSISSVTLTLSTLYTWSLSYLTLFVASLWLVRLGTSSLSYLTLSVASLGSSSFLSPSLLLPKQYVPPIPCLDGLNLGNLVIWVSM